MKQSLHLGKSISDNGFGAFVTMLAYKCRRSGKTLVKVSPWFASSQLGSHCGYQNKETKDLGLREWICPACGTHHDRDINAGKNLKTEGIRILTEAYLAYKEAA